MATMKTGTFSYNPANTYSFTNANTTAAENFAGITVYSLAQFAAQMTTSGVYRGLFLYKGVQATQSDLDGISTTAAISAWSGVHRYSDLLLVLPVSAIAYSGYNQVASLIANPAWASGTATWFMLGSQKSSAYYALLQAGTVGAIGSGADLEISDTNIVLGTTYKQPALNIVFPNSMSV